MKRTLVIGDIHGGLKALVQVLERANVTTKDTLIFLGDYVDGWSESAQVVDFLMNLRKKQSCIFIKGNHDIWCEEWLKYGGLNMVWLHHGGVETVESYYRLGEAMWDRHLSFFKKMPFYHIDEQNRLFIHAGYKSIYGPQKDLFQAINYAWDRSFWESALAMNEITENSSKLYLRKLNLFSEIFVGHTPTLNYDTTLPMRGYNVWNLDTGSAFTGKLTIMDIDTKEFWQSDKVQELYPYELGRN